MLASAACFTTNVLLIRALGQVQAVNVWLISCARFVMGIAVIYVAYRRECRPSHLFKNRKLAERGLYGGFGVLTFYLTVIHLGAGRATFINNTYVIWGAVMAAWFLGERLRPAVVAGGIAALAGLALLTHVFASGGAPGIYDAIGIICALASAYVVVTIRQLHATEHTSTIFAAQCVYGLVLCGVPALLHPQALSAGAWMLMLLAGVFAAVGQLAMTRAFRDLTITEGSLLQMLVPLGIAVGGVVFFAERFTATELVGAALIFGGTVVTALRAPSGVRPR